MYSKAVMSSVDADNDGILSGAELVELQRITVDTYASSNYFDYVVLGTDFLL